MGAAVDAVVAIVELGITVEVGVAAEVDVVFEVDVAFVVAVTIELSVAFEVDVAFGDDVAFEVQVSFEVVVIFGVRGEGAGWRGFKPAGGKAWTVADTTKSRLKSQPVWTSILNLRDYRDRRYTSEGKSSRDRTWGLLSFL